MVVHPEIPLEHFISDFSLCDMIFAFWGVGGSKKIVFASQNILSYMF